MTLFPFKLKFSSGVTAMCGALLLPALAQPAAACSFKPAYLESADPDQVKRWLQDYDYVVFAKAVAVRGFGPTMGELYPAAISQLKADAKKPYEYEVELVPETYWRGTRYKRLFASFHHEGGDCTFGMRAGVSYLIFGRLRPPGKPEKGDARADVPYLKTSIASPSFAVAEVKVKPFQGSLSGYWGVRTRKEAEAAIRKLGAGHAPDVDGSNIKPKKTK